MCQEVSSGFHRNKARFPLPRSLRNLQQFLRSLATCLPVLARGAEKLVGLIGWRPLGSGARVGR